jgi:hypothetical protein
VPNQHTIYRRWPSKGALLLDSLLSLNESGLDRVLDALFAGMRPS